MKKPAKRTPTYKLTKEDSIKGGKTVTKKKRIANSLRNRVLCRLSCPLYASCFAKYLSFSKFDGKCALKEFPHKIQQQTVNAILKGEEGIESMLLELWLDMASKDRYDDAKLRGLFYDAIKLKDAVYGRKERVSQDLSGEVRVVWGDGEVVKEKDEKVE